MLYWMFAVAQTVKYCTMMPRSCVQFPWTARIKINRLKIVYHESNGSRFHKSICQMHGKKMYAWRFFPTCTSCICICLHGFVFLGTASQEKEVYSFNPKAYIFWLIQHNEEDLASIKTLYKITAKSVLRLFLGKLMKS